LKTTRAVKGKTGTNLKNKRYRHEECRGRTETREGGLDLTKRGQKKNSRRFTGIVG